MQAARVEIGVDWFSMSLPVDKYPGAEWYQEAVNVIERIADDGNEAKSRSLLGYAGISVGNCFTGVGKSTYYCQLSGNYAQRHWEQLYRIEGHISRLDLQCTAHFNESSDRIGVDTLAVANNAAISRKGKPKWRVSRVEDNSGGFSMYIGSKDSEQYANIYDKGAESGNPAYSNSWRYEVRLKNEHATKAAEALFSHQRDREDTILGFVGGWFEKKGVTVPWSIRTGTTCLYTIAKGKTDKETALWWLAHQVKPALDKAKKLGYYGDALKALGVLEQVYEVVSRETGEIVDSPF